MADIKGKGRVWVNSHKDFDTYAIGIGSKKQDGTWANAYQEVRFKKDAVKPSNGDEIEFNAFTTAREWDAADGKKRSSVVWIITEFNNLSKSEENAATGSNFASQGHAVEAQVSGFTSLTDEDVPF